jgi:putative peptidoglycan lipid II flippase
VSKSHLPNVARAGGIMMLSLFLSRVLGIVRDMVMAAQFGRGADTDAYRLAFQIPDLIFFAVAGGALSSAFIPIFSEYLHTDREDEAWNLFSIVVTFMSLLVIGFILIAWIFAVPLSHLIADSATTNIPLVAHMSRILLPAQFAFFIGGLMFGTLYARQRFVAPGLGPNIYNLGIIFGAVALSQFFSPGIIGMAWGALIGAMTGNLLVPILVMRSLGSRFQPSLDLKHPGVKKVFKLMLPVVLGLSLPGVYAIIMMRFGSFYPDGTVTSLDLANKLMQAPLGIFGQSLAIAVFPALSQFFAQQRMDLYRMQIAGTLRTVIYITVPISAIMFVLAPQIVTAVFQYGRFEAADTHATALCLQMFAFGITFWCMHPILMRGFFAIHVSVTPIVIGTITTVLFVGLSWSLTATPLSYLGLPLASSLSAGALALMLMLFLNRKVGNIDPAGVAVTLGKSLLAALALVAVLYAGLAILPTGVGEGRNLWAIVTILVAGLAASWAYYFVSRLLKMPETKYVDRALAKISRSKEDQADPKLPAP